MNWTITELIDETIAVDDAIILPGEAIVHPNEVNECLNLDEAVDDTFNLPDLAMLILSYDSMN